MFPKITSKSDPDATIGSELRKELRKYWEPAAATIRAKLRRYPRQAFAVMIASILISGILAFTVLRKKDKESFSFRSQLTKGGFITGPAQFIRTASALQAVLALRGRVDTILQKAKPNRDDSLKLATALRQLDSIQHSIHHQP
jgi:hypothetical protein